MGVLQTADVDLSRARAGGAGPITDTAKEFMRLELAKVFWRWYRQHSLDVLIERRLLGLFKVSIRVRDLRGLFETLFGPEPAGA